MLRPGGHRHRVLALGAEPTAELIDAFTIREMQLDNLRGSPNAGSWSGVRGVLALMPKGYVELLKQRTRDVVLPAIHHGAKVVVVADIDDVPELTRSLKFLQHANQVQILVYPPAAQLIAEGFARHDPGPAFKASLLVDGETQLSDEERVLLRRAFHDCSRVSLEKLSGGRSAKVFCGFVTIVDSRVGPRPLPFFIKFDKQHKISRERANYLNCATNYIPFYLRPNLDDSRCAIGHERGILVGNFIEHSDSLAAVINRGAGQAVISSLFENALRGWRLQAYQPEVVHVEQPLAKSMNGAIHPATKAFKLQHLDRRAELAAQRHGSKYDRNGLVRLLENLPSIPHRRGFMHGDLHGENVRVRGNEAIIIDLASVGTGPLAADPAGLDVWLGFSEISMTHEEWKKFADDLYTLSSLVDTPLPKNEPDFGHRLWNSIRQIRRIALVDRMHPNEYATAVAVQLLRRALHKEDDKADDDRRVYGFALAERLALDLAVRG